MLPTAVVDERYKTGRVATFDVASHGSVHSIQPRLREAAEGAWTFELPLLAVKMKGWRVRLEGLGRVLPACHGTEVLLRFATDTWKSFTLRA